MKVCKFVDEGMVTCPECDSSDIKEMFTYDIDGESCSEISIDYMCHECGCQWRYHEWTDRDNTITTHGHDYEDDDEDEAAKAQGSRNVEKNDKVFKILKNSE